MLTNFWRVAPGEWLCDHFTPAPSLNVQLSFWFAGRVGKHKKPSTSNDTTFVVVLFVYLL
jgi:hypothetical protein